MRAEKLTLQTDKDGHLKGLPALPPHTPIEVILLFPETQSPKIRKAPPQLAGKVQILGDIISPAVPENEWDALQ